MVRRNKTKFETIELDLPVPLHKELKRLATQTDTKIDVVIGILLAVYFSTFRSKGGR